MVLLVIAVDLGAVLPKADSLPLPVASHYRLIADRERFVANLLRVNTKFLMVAACKNLIAVAPC
jgi:hypothetical protein